MDAREATLHAMIRLATSRDAEAIAAIYRPIVAATAISFETVPTARRRWSAASPRCSRSPPGSCTRTGRGRGICVWIPPSRARRLPVVGGRKRLRREGSRRPGSARSLWCPLPAPAIAGLLRGACGHHLAERGRASRCTNPSASVPSASIAGSATSSEPGTTSAGGSRRCGNGARNPSRRVLCGRRSAIRPGHRRWRANPSETS